MSESKHTKQEFEKGWKHLLTCINFDKSCFDAEAIRFMNEFPGKIMDVLDAHDKLLEACKKGLDYIQSQHRNDKNWGCCGNATGESDCEVCKDIRFIEAAIADAEKGD